MRLDQITAQEKRALGQLPGVASDGPEQSRRVADVLLAWWNPGQCGGYDITSGWGLDKDIAEDVITYLRWRRGWAAMRKGSATDIRVNRPGMATEAVCGCVAEAASGLVVGVS